MKLVNMFACAMLPLLFVSCAKEDSNNVNQDSIHQQYEILYVTNEDKTHVTSWFRFGGLTGTLLQLSDSAEVRFNNDVLLYNQLLGAHRKEYAGFVDSGAFVYNDLDGNTFSNVSPVIKPINYPTGLTEISMGSSFTFIWEGDPVGPNETVSLWIDGTQQGNAELFATILEGNTSLVLGANKLSNLGLGQATCWLVRTVKKDLDAGTSKGGYMEAKYRNVGTVNIVQ